MASANKAAHLVFISIVGADRVHYSYFRSKVAAEAVVTGSGLPWTMQRATQFCGYCLDGAQKAAELPSCRRGNSPARSGSSVFTGRKRPFGSICARCGPDLHDERLYVEPTGAGSCQLWGARIRRGGRT